MMNTLEGYGMDQMTTSGRFKVEQSKSGLSWQVVVEFVPDRIQYIGGFESEHAARNWVKSQSEAWLEKLSIGL